MKFGQSACRSVRQIAGTILQSARFVTSLSWFVQLLTPLGKYELRGLKDEVESRRRPTSNIQRRMMRAEISVLRRAAFA
jgi:hypothetical protein